MTEATVFEPGGFRYLKSVFQFSGGVAAEPGYVIERAQLATPLPLSDGFALVERHLASIGRPTTAFCACELRSPAPFTEQGFVDFNRSYVATLERWGLYADGDNPVARTNVCPTIGPPREPSLYAFSYTVRSTDPTPTFVVAGGAEAPEGADEYHGGIVRLGDTSLDGLREKLRYVCDEQSRRLARLGFTWRETNSTRAYSKHDVGPLLFDELLATGVADEGITWVAASPPVADCEFEMDARTVARELLIATPLSTTRTSALTEAGAG